MGWEEIVLKAAQYVAEEKAQRDEAAEMAATIAHLLLENNAAILEGVRNIVDAEFSQQKLEQCQNDLQTVSIFLEEYQNNTEDEDKLNEIDHTCQYVLNTLDDEDIRLVGLPSYVIAAQIRVLTLQTKAITQPNDLINARERAGEYVEYAENMFPVVRESVARRFGQPFECSPQPGVLLIGPCAGGWCYEIDGNVPFMAWPNQQSSCETQRETSIETEAEKIIGPIRDATETLRGFSLHGYSS